MKVLFLKNLIFGRKTNNDKFDNTYVSNNDKLSNEVSDLSGDPAAHYNKIMVENIKPVGTNKSKNNLDTYNACLLGGAIGDSLGWPVEFMDLRYIRNTYGKKGITDLKIKHNGKSEITDDTQMTIFTADGLLKSAIKEFDENKKPDMSVVYNSYQNWLATQKIGSFANDKEGWISNIDDLYASRAPGNTCIGSLSNGIPGSINKPVNNSEGCGGVMRVAPVGLMYHNNPEMAFNVGAECAALTHGHPNAYLAAGVHSCIIAHLINGESLESAVDNSINTLKTYKGSQKLVGLMEEAKSLAKSNVNSEIAIRKLGEGWHGDEAIAISTYCALKKSDNFKDALILAVNHDGDSDSTGAITGNILGAYLGLEKIPEDWKNTVELSSELKQIASDLYSKPCEIEDKETRYPVG